MYSILPVSDALKDDREPVKDLMDKELCELLERPEPRWDPRLIKE